MYALVTLALFIAIWVASSAFGLRKLGASKTAAIGGSFILVAALFGGAAKIVIPEESTSGATIEAVSQRSDGSNQRSDQGKTPRVGDMVNLTGMRGCETRLGEYGRLIYTRNAMEAKLSGNQAALEEAAAGAVELSQKSCYTELDGTYKVLEVSRTLEINDPTLGYDGSIAFLRVNHAGKDLWVME